MNKIDQQLIDNTIDLLKKVNEYERIIQEAEIAKEKLEALKGKIAENLQKINSQIGGGVNE